MDVKVKTAYVGLKIDGVRSWLWFKPESIKEEGGRVVATGGWGQGGAYTSLDGWGRDEWRVQDPESGTYCMAFSCGDHLDGYSLNPERDAREWLEDHQKAREAPSFRAGRMSKEAISRQPEVQLCGGKSSQTNAGPGADAGGRRRD